MNWYSENRPEENETSPTTNWYSENRKKDTEKETIPTIDKNLKVDDIVNTTSYVDSIRDYMID